MSGLSWLAVAAAVLAWPASQRSARLRTLVAGGRLVEVGRVRVRPRPRIALPTAPTALLIGLVAGGVGWWTSDRPIAITVAVITSIAAAVVGGIIRASLADRSARMARDELHLMLGILCGELEAGAAPVDAVRAARNAVPRFAPALDGLLTTGEGPSISSLTVAWRIAEQTGAPLVEVLDQVRADVAADRELHRAVSVTVAGPRSSAVLLAGLPVLGVGLGAAIGARPLSVLFGSAAGHVLLIVGVALDAAGVLWTQRLIRSVRPRVPP